MLSSKGIKVPRNDDLSLVSVLLQTGRRMRAILNLRLSAEALARQTQ
jgi:hypothetical protein